MQAVIMAGGDGTRLRPLTCEVPKPMIPVANRPVMWYILDVLARHRLDEVYLTLRCMPELITGYIEAMEDWRQRCTSCIEPKPLGTAGSVKLLERRIRGTFVVVSGDALTDVDLTKLVQFHREKGGLVTIALTKVANPLEYGVVLTSPDGRIEAFLEKPSWGEVFSDLANTGIYVLEKEVLDYIPGDKEFDFSRDLFPLLLQRGIPLFGVEIGGYWCDIGNIREYVRAHMDIMTGKVGDGWFRFDDRGVIISDGAEIHRSAVIKGPAIIGRNVTVGRDARIEPFCVIGSDVVIADGASLKRSVVWDNCYIGPWAELRGAVIAQGVRLKDGARLFEGSVIGARSVIGEGSVVRPSVMVWPGKSIEPGSTLNESLVWHSSWPSSLFGRDGIAGTINLSLTPELSSRIGAVFGSLLSPGSRVVIGTAGHRGDQMLKHCVAGGLLSTGVTVLDAGSISLPALRHAVRKLADGGVYIAQKDEHGHARMVLLDAEGVNLNKPFERKFDSAFAREELRRAHPQRTGYFEFRPGLEDLYLDEFLNVFDLESIGCRRFKIVGLCGQGPVAGLIPKLADKLGADMRFNVDEGLGDCTGEGRWSDDLAQLAEAQGADLGVFLSGDGEGISLVDGVARCSGSQRRKLLASWLLARDSGRKVVAVPFGVPGFIEKVASEIGKEIVWCRDTPRSLLDASRRIHTANVLPPQSVGVADGGEGERYPDEFSLSYDGLALMMKCLEVMAKESLRFAQLVEPFGGRWFVEKRVACRSEAKGRVMRLILERFSSERGTVVDGVRLRFGDDSVLVVPDPLEPFCLVYVDADSQEKADRLANQYGELIERASLVEA